MKKVENSYFSKQFILCLIISLSLILLFLLFGVNEGYKVDMVEANQTLTEVEKLRQTATSYSIFVNNMQIALISFVPLLGVVWALFIQFNTGYVIGSMAKGLGWNPYMLASYVLTSPVGLLEYSAYMFALGESFILVFSALNREFKERLTKQTWKTVLLVTGLLLLGAIVESWII